MRIGKADVDGDPGEWTDADRIADLSEGGSATRPDRGTLFLRYDCTDRVLYVYIDAEPDGPLKPAPRSATFVRIDGRVAVTGRQRDNGRAPDGHWVDRHGSRAAGWEASTRLRPGEHRLQIHALVRVRHRTLSILAVPPTLTILIDCPSVPKPTAAANPTEPPKPTPGPSAKPDPTAAPTPTATPKPTPAPMPTSTPPPSPSPSPTCPPDDETQGERHGGKPDCGDTGGDAGNDAGFVLVLPILTGVGTWIGRPRRLRGRGRTR